MWFRVYIDRAKGNDHVRVVDVEADGVDDDALRDAEAKAKAELKQGEVVGHIARIYPEDV